MILLPDHQIIGQSDLGSFARFERLNKLQVQFCSFFSSKTDLKQPLCTKITERAFGVLA
jgi:hypothetical protein